MILHEREGKEFNEVQVTERQRDRGTEKERKERERDIGT
jgi:hypothetical protein